MNLKFQIQWEDIKVKRENKKKKKMMIKSHDCKVEKEKVFTSNDFFFGIEHTGEGRFDWFA